MRCKDYRQHLKKQQFDITYHYDKFGNVSMEMNSPEGIVEVVDHVDEDNIGKEAKKMAIKLRAYKKKYKGWK